MTDINLEIARLVQYGVKKGASSSGGRRVRRQPDTGPAEIKRLHPGGCSGGKPGKPQPILNRIIDWAAENGLLESNSSVYRDLLDTEIMLV